MPARVEITILHGHQKNDDADGTHRLGSAFSRPGQVPGCALYYNKKNCQVEQGQAQKILATILCHH